MNLLRVEGGVHQGVGVGVVLAPYVRDVDLLVLVEECERLVAQWSQVCLLHAPAPSELLDDEQDPHRLRCPR